MTGRTKMSFLVFRVFFLSNSVTLDIKHITLTTISIEKKPQHILHIISLEIERERKKERLRWRILKLKQLRRHINAKYYSYK